MSSVMFTEPRITAIKSMLEQLLQVVELEHKGEPVEIDGFRLRNLSDWIADFPGGLTPDLLLDGLASSCNVSCEFCYVKGAPPDWNIKDIAHRSLADEIETRLRYYDEERNRALFPTVSQYYEPFKSPKATEYIAQIRRKSKGYLHITTNGRGLTEPVIARLAELKPIHLVVSLNSNDPEVRSQLMKDTHPEIAIRALELLHTYEIPFSVSHVPWPTVPTEKLQESLLYAAACGAQTLRVSLPGYTKYNGASAGWFDTEKYWTELLDAVLPLRHRFEAPILIYPYLFEERYRCDQLNEPIVVGVGIGSPARVAGFQVGDVVRSINGKRMISRTHARTQLHNMFDTYQGDIDCEVERNGKVFNLHMVDVNSPQQYGYPYISEHGQCDRMGPFGLYMPAGFRRQNLTLLKRAILEAGARRVMVATTRLMKPLLEKALAQSDFYMGLNAEVHFVIPRSLFFGGGIFMGDLLVNSDIISCIQDFAAQNGKPDLVCLSSSMFTTGFGWWRDLNGRVYREIERTTGIPVRLIPQEAIGW